MRLPGAKGPAGPVHAVRRTGQPGPRFNYELFNHNNFNIRYWSWNYRGCWPLRRLYDLRRGSRPPGGARARGPASFAWRALEMRARFRGGRHVPQAARAPARGDRHLGALYTGARGVAPPPLRSGSA